jgi:hypothetical protein
MNTTASQSAELDRVHELILDHKGENWSRGFTRRNRWGGWDYGKPGQPIMRTTVEDTRISVHTFSGYENTGSVHFDGRAANAYLVTATAEAYL